MTITFEEACDLSRQEIAELRAYTPDKALFDRAMDRMRKQRWSCDLKTGTTRNLEGVQTQFKQYDWALHYEAHPDHIFYDFFRGTLLNKVSRLQRDLTI